MAVKSRQDLWAEGERLASSAAVSARSAMESGVIASLIAERGLDCYIDVGCWYGFLLRRVLERSRLRRAIAVDAVEEFVECARGRTAGLAPAVEFRACALAPESLPAGAAM
jgi:hypothetical protein